MDEKQILNILLEMQQEMRSQREEMKSQREELKAQREEMKSFREEVMERLDSVEQQLSALKEDTEITRTAANHLLAWAEDVQTQVGIPLYKKAQ